MALKPEYPMALQVANARSVGPTRFCLQRETMSKHARPAVRKPATKFPNLQKKLQKGKQAGTKSVKRPRKK
jgi:hypothetical protein